MALSTAQDLCDFALRIASVNGVGQAPAASDEADTLLVVNMLLTEWQLNRWLVWNIVEASFQSTGAGSYTVGSGGNFPLSFAGGRPDIIDSAYARTTDPSSGLPVDTFLYPFMAREGYDRVASKTLGGYPPEAFFYDAGATVGMIYFYPVPDATWTLRIKAKSDLGQFASLSAPLSTLPQAYITALLWNTAERLRPLYGMQPRPDLSAMATTSLQAIVGSSMRVMQAQQPTPSARSGVYSHLVAPQAAEASK